MDAIEYLNLGAEPDDGTGDSARDGGAKLNRNAAKFKAAIDSMVGLTLAAGPVTKLAPGANPTASLTGTAPNYTLNLGLPEGAAGAGAPNSADILAIAEKDRLERAIATAGVPDEPSLILDFVRGVHFASKSAIAASILTLIVALGGASTFTRASTATYWDSDGLLKTAANNVPRLNHDPVTRQPRGLLFEGWPRANQLLYSEDLGAGVWGLNEATIVANAGVDPRGTVTADKLVPNGNNAAHFAVNFSPVSIVSGQLYGGSVFLQAGGYTKGIVRFTDAALGSSGIIFDLTTGGLGTYGTAPLRYHLMPCGGGRFLLRWMTMATATKTTTSAMVVSVLDAGGNEIFVGNGTDGLYVWGGQVEDGWPSSYIPTGASAVARMADNLVLAGGRWLAEAGMTVVAEFSLEQMTAGTGVSSPVLFGNAAVDHIVQLREGDVIAGVDLLTFISGTYPVGSGTYGAALETPMRFAFGIDATGWAYAKNNALSLTGGPAAYPSGLDRLYLGASGTMGHIRRIIAYPQRLPNAKVQALSNQAWS